ncbi:hypothetical protein HBI56_074750 [Parastagonospora nodorum]|nr:hypothetical protein HBH53_144150 [Parastagonospora nodorum]KAH3983970.1 hypothetical protein HBH52_060080 [Parastagonospora nodorum]KAH4225868.1 hypothetical protein HBI06_112680 [Parastagonospora nodorum]KAH4247331.1 hypothetical protein HBI05_043760 [Parastagonospora nodorum]KAH4339184.1 hypothetical protein HBH98_210040 [Parastagonospora nodorum]
MSMSSNPQAKLDMHPKSHDTPNSRPFGIYLHTDLSDPTGSNATLAVQAPDFSSAYVALLQHAGAQIGDRPDWGATRQGTNNHVYEVSTWDRAVVMRYSIELLREDEPDGPSLRQPRQHYGMFVELSDRKETFYVSGAETLGEACHAMKMSAAAYIAQHAGVKLMEKNVELLDEKGVVRQRYEVLKGRNINGRFVKEDDWINGHGEGEVPGVVREDKTPILRAAPPPAKKTPRAHPKHAPKATPLPAARVILNPPRAARARTPNIAADIAPSAPSTPAPPRRGTRMCTPNFVLDLEQAAPPPQLPGTPAPQVQPATAELWCICRAPNDGRLLVACDNDACETEWYHPACLGLTQAPEGKWLCPMCAPRRGGKRRGTGTPAPMGKKRKKRKTR